MLNGRARINQIELDDNTISALDSNLVLQTAVGQQVIVDSPMRVNDLLIDSNKIMSLHTSGNLELRPHGDGRVIAKGRVVVDNLKFEANTISATNTGGDILLTPESGGSVTVNHQLKVGTLTLEDNKLVSSTDLEILPGAGARVVSDSPMRIDHLLFESNTVSVNSDGSNIDHAQSVRLVDGSSSASGRLEVEYNGAWGTVCTDRFGAVDAKVTCAQLGYDVTDAASYTFTQVGGGTGSIMMDEVACTGSEAAIQMCPMVDNESGGAVTLSFGGGNCNHGEDVGVSCTGVFVGPAVRPTDMILKAGPSCDANLPCCGNGQLAYGGACVCNAGFSGSSCGEGSIVLQSRTVIDALSLSGDTIEITAADTDLVLQPHGEGKVIVTNTAQVDNLLIEGNTITNPTPSGSVQLQASGDAHVQLSGTTRIEGFTFSGHEISSGEHDINILPHGS